MKTLTIALSLLLCSSPTLLAAQQASHDEHHGSFGIQVPLVISEDASYAKAKFAEVEYAKAELAEPVIAAQEIFTSDSKDHALRREPKDVVDKTLKSATPIQEQQVAIVTSTIVVPSPTNSGGKWRPTGVCVFDIDRTLTASQRGPCPEAIATNIPDKAYEFNRQSLKEAKFARKALKTCADNGFAIGIASHAPGCSKGIINDTVEKYAWLDQMFRETAGYSLDAHGIGEAPASIPAAIQCGGRSKVDMIALIQEYWEIPLSSIVFFEDLDDNIDNIKSDPRTASVTGQMVSTGRRPGEWCGDLKSQCCGITADEFYAGFNKALILSGVSPLPYVPIKSSESAAAPSVSSALYSLVAFVFIGAIPNVLAVTISKV